MHRAPLPAEEHNAQLSLLTGMAAAELMLAAGVGILRTMPAPDTDAVAAFLALMLTTASWTASGRLRQLWHGRRAAVAGVVLGAAVSLALIFAMRLVAFEVRYVVAVSGIVIGGVALVGIGGLVLLV